MMETHGLVRKVRYGLTTKTKYVVPFHKGRSQRPGLVMVDLEW